MRDPLVYGGEGGITQKSLRAVLALRASRLWRLVLNAPKVAFGRTKGIVYNPVYHKRASPLKAGSCVYGGEGGIRTLDTLPYTHFPGVRLRPLGHLSVGADSSTVMRRLNWRACLKRGANLKAKMILLRGLGAIQVKEDRPRIGHLCIPLVGERYA